jgi:hypothetical protein
MSDSFLRLRKGQRCTPQLGNTGVPGVKRCVKLRLSLFQLDFRLFDERVGHFLFEPIKFDNPAMSRCSRFALSPNFLQLRLQQPFIHLRHFLFYVFDLFSRSRYMTV